MPFKLKLLGTPCPIYFPFVFNLSYFDRVIKFDYLTDLTALLTLTDYMNYMTAINNNMPEGTLNYIMTISQ